MIVQRSNSLSIHFSIYISLPNKLKIPPSIRKLMLAQNTWYATSKQNTNDVIHLCLWRSQTKKLLPSFRPCVRFKKDSVPGYGLHTLQIVSHYIRLALREKISSIDMAIWGIFYETMETGSVVPIWGISAIRTAICN